MPDRSPTPPRRSPPVGRLQRRLIRRIVTRVIDRRLRRLRPMASPPTLAKTVTSRKAGNILASRIGKKLTTVKAFMSPITSCAAGQVVAKIPENPCVMSPITSCAAGQVVPKIPRNPCVMSPIASCVAGRLVKGPKLNMLASAVALRLRQAQTTKRVAAKKTAAKKAGKRTK